MDVTPRFIVQNQMKESISVRKVKTYLPSLKYCCWLNMDVEAFKRLLVTLVISPSLLMTRTSSVLADVDDLKPIVLMLLEPITESENNFGVREPVFDRVTYLFFSEKKKEC